MIHKTDPLFNWTSLNAALKKMTKLEDEAKCWSLLEEEKDGRARQIFLLRIHSTANKLRRLRERNELLKGA